MVSLTILVFSFFRYSCFFLPGDMRLSSHLLDLIFNSISHFKFSISISMANLIFDLLEKFKIIFLEKYAADMLEVV